MCKSQVDRNIFFPRWENSVEKTLFYQIVFELVGLLRVLFFFLFVGFSCIFNLLGIYLKFLNFSGISFNFLFLDWKIEELFLKDFKRKTQAVDFFKAYLFLSWSTPTWSFHVHKRQKLHHPLFSCGRDTLSHVPGNMCPSPPTTTFVFLGAHYLLLWWQAVMTNTEMEGVHGARKVGTLCGVGVGAGVGWSPHSVDPSGGHVHSRGWFLYLEVTLPFINVQLVSPAGVSVQMSVEKRI